MHLESGNMPSFAEADPRRYWEAADSHERSNGRLFRSMTVALPNSLSFASQLLLAQAIAEHVTGGELPYTLAIHAGRSKDEGVPDNPHFHLVFSERVNDGVARVAEQWFRRASPAGRDPASGGARKTERTKPREWLGETRKAVAVEMNLAFEQAGVDDWVTAESHATQLARAREFGNTAEEIRLLLNPPSAHIGPAAKQCWTERGQKLDRYVQWEAGAASAQELQLAHALDEDAAAAAKSEVAELTAQIAAQEAQLAAERRADLEEREGTVRTTSKGGQWLDEAHQAALAGGDRELTLDEKEQSVETVEGQLEAEFSRLESELSATSAGPALLREEFGDRDARLSLAEWERGLERVKQRVDEELRTQEEALRLIPLGKQYLSEAEQPLAAEAAGPPARAELESMVRAVAQRVGEELDRLEEELVAIAGSENLRAEAAGAGDGRTLSLGEQWEDYERVKSGLEAELDHEEAAVREDPAGEEFLRDARLDVLGSADREAATLSERARIVKAAAEAKRHAEEKWNEEKAARVKTLGAQLGGLDLYHAHLADLDPKSLTENTPPTREHDAAALAAADSDDTRLERLHAVLSDEPAAARYREVLDAAPGQFNTADLDSALVAGEREREHLDALEIATEAAQAAAAESDVKLDDDTVRAIYETGETHAAGMAAVELTTVALAAAAAQKLPSKTIINTLNANESDPGRIAPALAAATAAAREEEERKEAQAAARREKERKEAQAAARREKERKEVQAAARREKERKEAQAAARREKERTAPKPAKPRRPARNYQAVDEHIAHRLRSAGLYGVMTSNSIEYAFRQHKVTDPSVVDEAIDILAGKKTGRGVPAALAANVKKNLASIAPPIAWAKLTREAPATSAPVVPPAQAAKKTKPQAPAPSAPSAAAARGPAAPSTPRQVPATQQATSAAAAQAPAAPSTPRQVPTTQVQQTAAEQERKARDKRWEALPAAAQEEARAWFDQLEPGRKGAPSAQRFEQVVGDVENLVTKTYDREESQLREREWHPTDKNGDELLKRARIDAFGTDREPVNLRERGAVLDAANILDAADRGFESANRQIEERLEITPSHASVREAAADTASTTGWLRKVMDAIASGKARPVYDDPGPKGENTQLLQKCIDDNRAAKERAADKQHAREMKDWQALGAVRRRFTPRPEPPEPEDPDPPTPEQITGWRSHVLRWARKAITDAAEYCKRKIFTADHLRTTLRAAQRHEPTHDQDRGGIQR